MRCMFNIANEMSTMYKFDAITSPEIGILERCP